MVCWEAIVVADTFDARITEALARWADQHPHPDDAVLSVAGGVTLTPRQLAREVQDRTPFGQKQLQVLRHFAEQERGIGADGLIGMFETSAIRR